MKSLLSKGRHNKVMRRLFKLH